MHATLTDVTARMDRRHMRGGRGWKLRRQFFDLAMFGDVFDEGRILKAFIETPAKSIH